MTVQSKPKVVCIYEALSIEELYKIIKNEFPKFKRKNLILCISDSKNLYLTENR